MSSKIIFNASVAAGGVARVTLIVDAAQTAQLACVMIGAASAADLSVVSVYLHTAGYPSTVLPARISALASGAVAMDGAGKAASVSSFDVRGIHVIDVLATNNSASARVLQIHSYLS